MKSYQRIFFALLLLGVVTVVSTPLLRAATQSDDVLLRQARGREVVKTALNQMLNFRKTMPLSEEQKSKIRVVVESHSAEIKAQAKRGSDARAAFREASRNAPESEEALAAATEIGEVARSRALLGAKIRAEVRPLLTPEQQDYLESAIKEVQVAIDQLLVNL